MACAPRVVLRTLPARGDEGGPRRIGFLIPRPWDFPQVLALYSGADGDVPGGC